MTLNCRICSREFTSLVIPQEKALQESVNAVATHCAKEHPKVIKKFNVEMATIGGLAMGIALLNKIIVIPVTETFVQESIEKDTQKLMEVLGYVEETKPNNAPDNQQLFGDATRAEAD